MQLLIMISTGGLNYFFLKKLNIIIMPSRALINYVRKPQDKPKRLKITPLKILNHQKEIPMPQIIRT